MTRSLCLGNDVGNQNFESIDLLLPHNRLSLFLYFFTRALFFYKNSNVVLCKPYQARS